MFKDIVEFNEIEYNARHGGAFDRGAADSYYGRPRRPHYFLGGTYQSKEIVPEVGTAEHEAYCAGYNWNEENGNKKEWD